MGKIWKKIRKITGKHSVGISPCVKINGNIETDHKKVADALASNISQISSTEHYEQNIRSIKILKESVTLNIKATRQYEYTEEIMSYEITAALKSYKDTAPEEINPLLHD